MTLPTGMLTAGLHKEIAKTQKAFEKRLKKAADLRATVPWVYHMGAPDPNNLPREKTGVWLALETVVESEADRHFHGTAFTSTWNIRGVIEDRGSDDFGYDIGYANEVLTKILEVLTEADADVALDDNADFTGRYATRIDIGKSGDRRLAWTESRIEVKHHILYRAT